MISGMPAGILRWVVLIDKTVWLLLVGGGGRKIRKGEDRIAF